MKKDENTMTDNTAELQAMIDALLPGGGTLHLPAGHYRFTQLTIPTNVSIEGDGQRQTYLEATGPGPSLLAQGRWLFQYFRGFTISHLYNPNNAVDMLVVQEGVENCRFDDLRLIGKAGVTRHGIVIDALGPQGQRNNTYYNQFANLLFTCEGGQAQGIGLYLKGSASLGVSANMITGGFFGGWQTGIHIQGAGNTFTGAQFYPSDIAGVRVVDAQVSVPANVFFNCWWDDGGAWPERKFFCENDRETVYPWVAGKNMALFVSCWGVEKDSHVQRVGLHPELVNIGFLG